jgi:hypothetical protein
LGVSKRTGFSFRRGFSAFAENGVLTEITHTRNQDYFAVV